jgi:sulfate/thiosulfate transport system substrate-binding protein
VKALVLAALSVFFVAAPLGANAAGAPAKLLNVSYDPTRELYAAYNKAFASYWQRKTGQTVTIDQSHGGSGAQARAVIDGLDADVVTLALAYDIDAIAQKAKLLPLDWQKQFPDNSTPYTSTIVFVVRKGNPKHIRDWGDLVKPGVSLVTPNPKTGGGARWNFLAAWGWALKRNHNDEAKARAFVGALYKNVAVLDTGARGATISFAERQIGDVLIAWENEGFFLQRTSPKDGYEIVVPSVSILAEPSVAVVDVNARKHGTTALAHEYLQYLYSPEAQKLECGFGYRPRLTSVLGRCGTHFERTDLVTIATFGGWQAANARFFAEGGVYDQISAK